MKVTSMRTHHDPSASLQNHPLAATTPLFERWQAYQRQNPGGRIYDVARALDVSELELIAQNCGVNATRLRCDAAGILQAAHELGKIMALTRNEHAVIEKVGEYGRVEISGHVGVVHHGEIDLRLFLAYWRHAYAVEAAKGDAVLRSLQFFDARGIAVHKIYLKDPTKLEAFQALVAKFRENQVSETLTVEPPRKAKTPRPDDDVDAAALHASWQALSDTHDFFKLLRTHDVEREQALRLVGDDFASRVDPQAFRLILEKARDQSCSIMVFVGNHGMIEIHTGPVVNLKAMGPWYNVLDPNFNLHLREDRIASAWIVRKPTKDGIVSSLELFAEDGFLIAQIFGERKPGQSELATWRSILGDIESTLCIDTPSKASLVQ